MSWPWGSDPAVRVRRRGAALAVAAACTLGVAALPGMASATTPSPSTTTTTPAAGSTTTTSVPGTTPLDAAIVAQASADVHAPLPALPAVARQYTDNVDPAVLLQRAFALLQAGNQTASLNESLSQLQATMQADSVKANQAAQRAKAVDAAAAQQENLAQELSSSASSLTAALQNATLSLYMTGQPTDLPVAKPNGDTDAVVDAIVGEQVALSPQGLLSAQKTAAAAAKADGAKAVAAKAQADALAAQQASAERAVAAEVTTEQDELSSLKTSAAQTLETESSTLTQQAGQDLTTASTLNFTPTQAIPPPVATTEAALTWAFSELGKEYVWGGTGPNVFDCSGLTQYSWAHAGVSIPRVAIDQYNATVPVPLSQLRPGDLVFFGTDVHHVGMYIGGGMMINAPYTGTVVQISPIWYSDLLGFGRVTSPGTPIPAHSTANGNPVSVDASIGDVPSQTGSSPSDIVGDTTTTTAPATSPTTTPSRPISPTTTTPTTTSPSSTTTTVPPTTTTTTAP